MNENEKMTKVENETLESFFQLDWGTMPDEEKIKAVLNLANLFIGEEQEKERKTRKIITIQLRNDDEDIKNIQKILSKLSIMSTNLPENPDKELWLNRESGILAQQKKSYKEQKENIECSLNNKLRERARELISSRTLAKDDESVTLDMGKSIEEETKRLIETYFQPIENLFKKIRETISSKP